MMRDGDRCFDCREHVTDFLLDEIAETLPVPAARLDGGDDTVGGGNAYIGGVPFAGMVHPDSPPSGAYGGTSIVWFPTPEHGSLIDFGVGTRGLAPDEGILTRPGHRRVRARTGKRRPCCRRTSRSHVRQPRDRRLCGG